jgi:hypothetical protein
MYEGNGRRVKGKRKREKKAEKERMRKETALLSAFIHFH